MATIVQTFQAALPLGLFERLERVRNRYASALLFAGKGDYSLELELRAATRYLGRLLAQEARKSPEERGGMRMMEISLAVDRFFPELRGWHQHDALQRQRKRLVAMIQASAGALAEQNGPKAS